MNECEYSPSGKHNCKHQHYCIFNNNRVQLEHEIITLSNRIEEFKHIKHCFINDEIIYHKDLADYYTIEKGEYIGTDGNIHYKTGVTVKDGFVNAVNHRIKVLEYDLKNLEQYRLDVVHGKIDGYGVLDLC